MSERRLGPPSASRRRRIGLPLRAALLTPLVLLVHGFHPFANDAGIYTAAVRHMLDPTLYPLNAAFATAFTRFSIFPWAVAALVRVGHLPLAWTLLLLQLASAWLFLVACGELARRLFSSDRARVCSVLLAAACFTLPVTGTALSLMDPYVTPRSFSTPLCLLAIAAAIDRDWLRTTVLLILAAAIHPLMAAYAAGFVILYAAVAAGRVRLAYSLCVAPILVSGAAFLAARLAPASPAYRQAVSLEPRSFLFLARWHWYEILGLVLPLALLALGARGTTRFSPIRTVCGSCLLLGFTAVIIAALFVPATGPYLLVPLQVLRSFHLIYALGVVLAGGVLAGLLNRSRAAALTLAVLLFAGMFAAQRLSWPACRHIEWPWTAPANPWQQAFLWIRANTPHRAVFAFNPKLLYQPGENEQSFRAISERDQLADDKDAGIVAVLPGLASRWAAQRNAELNVNRMTDAERGAKLIPLGATWLLLPPSAPTRFPCPFRNQVIAACKMAP